MTRHIRCRRPQLTPSLRLCMKWWLEVLDLGIWYTLWSSVWDLPSTISSLCFSEKRKWRQNAGPPVYMFCDARSTPPRAAAVLFWLCMVFYCVRHVKSLHFALHSDGNVTYCDVEPPAEVLSFFRRRRDNQIMSLELLSIAYG